MTSTACRSYTSHLTLRFYHYRWLKFDDSHSSRFTFSYRSSTCGLVCLSLSDPSGTSQLNVFRLSEAMNHASNNSSTGKITRTHQLITIPGDCVATGPVMMALDTRLSPDQSRHVWLGTAGGGHCHELDLNTRQFAQRLVSMFLLYSRKPSIVKLSFIHFL